MVLLPPTLRVCTDAIWEGLENAASIVVKDTASATSGFIHHRYGADAGALASDAGAAVVGVTTTAINIKRVGVKPFVLATAQAGLREHVVGSGDVDGAGAGAGTAVVPAPPPRVASKPLS